MGPEKSEIRGGIPLSDGQEQKIGKIVNGFEEASTVGAGNVAEAANARLESPDETASRISLGVPERRKEDLENEPLIEAALAYLKDTYKDLVTFPSNRFDRYHFSRLIKSSNSNDVAAKVLLEHSKGSENPVHEYHEMIAIVSDVDGKITELGKTISLEFGAREPNPDKEYDYIRSFEVDSDGHYQVTAKFKSGREVSLGAK